MDKGEGGKTLIHKMWIKRRVLFCPSLTTFLPTYLPTYMTKSCQKLFLLQKKKYRYIYITKKIQIKNLIVTGKKKKS